MTNFNPKSISLGSILSELCLAVALFKTSLPFLPIPSELHSNREACNGDAGRFNKCFLLRRRLRSRSVVCDVIDFPSPLFFGLSLKASKAAEGFPFLLFAPLFVVMSDIFMPFSLLLNVAVKHASFYSNLWRQSERLGLPLSLLTRLSPPRTSMMSLPRMPTFSPLWCYKILEGRESVSWLINR